MGVFSRFTVFFSIFFILSCQAGPESAPPEKIPPKAPSVTVEEPKPAPKPPEKKIEYTGGDERFDPLTIPSVVYEMTKVDIQQWIITLNHIIRNRDYEAWVSNLEKDYFMRISSPAYLAQISNSARLKGQKVILTDPESYFLKVVVPSRANDRVDDIEFVSQHRIKAFTINAKGQRLRLYDLENVGNGWKIIN
ncbi:hypothetical protein AGMMS49991_00070 [Spirochaetia bacterium]|nr:hypothetical protein AGMMS49991_00070 [Spirochaetia bacterium]